MKKTTIVFALVCLFSAWGWTQEAVSVRNTSPLVAVTAKVTDASGKSVSGLTTYLSVKGSPNDVRAAVTNEKGLAEFLLPSLPPTGQMIFQAEPSKAEGIRFETFKPLFTLTGERNNNEATYRFQDTTIFYGIPDQVYLLDDYTRFATLEEVFREFVAEVRITKQGKDFQLTVMNRPYKSFFENPPLVLLDGVPVFDMNRLMEVDPLKLKQIDVVARKYYLGKLLNFGIISLFSFDGDLAGYSLPASALVTPFGK